jgi:NAD(P)-dependent dehydrogenase (short-subunit alcohol dehydrogenase family)
MYGISKLLEGQYSRVLAGQLRGRAIGVVVCSPGYVKTDMTSGRGTKPVAEGADTPVWLATLPLEEFMALSGTFVADRKVEPF